MNDQQRSLAAGGLYTDFYQLTMAQLYFRMGLHEMPAQFDYFYRSNPDYGSHQAGYCIFAGMQWLLDWMKRARFDNAAIEALRGQRGPEGKPLFDNDFLRWLGADASFDRISIRAVAEGRVIHPNTPAAAVRGPFAITQILESSLLNHCNFQTLIATKASRIKRAGRGGMTIDFGLRRAPDSAANAGARAALIGGADFSSNTGISCALGYPPKGTHAHSMVQAFMALGEGELGAFRAYAEVYPDNCLLLVDTINTLESGIPNAIKVFEELRRKGHKPMGVRLDSGDLAYLAIMSARQLDQAGFEETSIVLSNQLDELVLSQIIAQIKDDAPSHGVDPDRLIARLVYGVGTRLITSKGCGALDGVYKLVAIKEKEAWKPAFKISEDPGKTLNPGYKRLWRLYDQEGKATADCISREEENIAAYHHISLRHPFTARKKRTLDKERLSKIEELLEDTLVNGKRAGNPPSIENMRALRDKDLARLDAGVKRLINPHIYHVSLTESLWHLKRELIAGEKQ